MSPTLARWPEKVERSPSTDWRSPMSARTASKKPTRLPGAAATSRPARAISAASPTVFMQHGLAARVRAADHQDRRGARADAEGDVVGDDVPGRGRVGQREQRVPGRAQVDRRRVEDLDRAAAVREPQAGRRRPRVDGAERRRGPPERGRADRDVGGQRLQDAPRLAPDVELDHLEPVVRGHERGRLDEHGLAGARGVVHDAETERLGARLERQDVTFGADGEELVLEHGRVLVPAHQGLDRAPGVVSEPLSLLPQAGQLRRGGVAQLAGRVEGLVDDAGEAGRRVEGLRERRDLGRGGTHRTGRRHREEEAARDGGEPNQHRDRAKLVGAEHHRLFRRGERPLDLRSRQRRQHLCRPQQRRQLRDPGHAAAGLGRVRGEGERETQCPPAGRLGHGGEPGGELGPVERVEGSRVRHGNVMELACRPARRSRRRSRTRAAGARGSASRLRRGAPAPPPRPSCR